MTVHATVLTDRVDAVPGALVTAQVALVNEGSVPATVSVRVVGLDDARPAPPTTVAVAAGGSAACMVPVAVPDSLGAGDHAAAVEVVSDRPGDRPSLHPFTVSIGSIERVEVRAVPSTIRGLRRARLRVDVANHEPTAVELDVTAEAPDVSVRFRRPRVRVEPGQHALLNGRIKGPRQWFGETTQHNLVITGHGPASAATAKAVFIQRPLFARQLRVGLAALLAISLWLGAIGGFAWWWTHRDADEVAAGTVVEAVDTDGDGVIDRFVLADGTVITGIDTDGDGEPDAFFDAAGNPVPDPRQGGGAGGGGGSGGGGSGGGPGGPGGPGGGGSDGPAAPRAAVVRGTVKADGDLTGISITLTPLSLTAAADGPADAGPSALAGGPGRSLGPVTTGRPDDAAGATPTKLWSARAAATDAALPRRGTEPVRPMLTNPGADGVWLFADVLVNQSYELVFAKPGFDTQSFVITPPDDGSAVELDVELEPAEGAIAGRVFGPSGPLGGVTVTVTDGILTFTTTTATVGDVGSWSLEHVSTPGVYTVTATRHGYGTEVRQVALGPGDQFTGADLRMQPGVGSIAGRIVGPDGAPLGGASVTAATADGSYTTTSLTDGDIGSYLLPRLEIPGSYTVTVELDGYLTQSRRLPLAGPLGGVDFTMVGTTLSLTGKVTTAGTGEGIANVGLTLTTQGTSGDLTFKAATAGGANAGTFLIDDLPPGEYTVRFEHYLHVTSTQLVTLAAGVTPPPLDVRLEPSGGIDPVGTGSLVVMVVDNEADSTANREIDKARVRVVRTSTGETVYDDAPGTFNVQINDLPVGTYTVYVTAPGYSPAPARRVTIGLTQERIEVDMVKLGQASGRLIDSVTEQPITSPYMVVLYREPVLPGDLPVASVVASEGVWETEPDSLLPGVYRIEIADNNSPSGYLVRNDQLLDDTIVATTPAGRFMRFRLPEGTGEPVVVADIEADRYPVLSGRVYRPEINPVGVQGVDLVPIDSPSLEVTVTCTDGLRTVNVSVDDLSGVIAPDGTFYDTFTLSPTEVDDDNLTGDCTFTISADGFVTATATLDDVDANDGSAFNDRRLHVALAPPAPKIGGRVFWKDGATVLPLAGVDISAEPVTGFGPRESNADETDPQIRRTARSTKSAADGRWDLDGQVYGITNYTFNVTDFGAGTVEITVDDSGAAARAGAGTRVTTTPDGRFDVELSNPRPRTLTGTIVINSTTAPIDLTGFAVSATAPGLAAPVTTDDECSDGPAIVLGAPDHSSVGLAVPYEICNAVPGTWTVTVTPPAGYVPAGGAALASVTKFAPLGPVNTPVPGYDVALDELATVRLTLRTLQGAPLDLTGVDLDDLLDVSGVVGDPDVDLAGNVVTVRGLPADVADPLGTPIVHRFGLEVPGRDVPSAVATIGQAALAIGRDGSFEVGARAGDEIAIVFDLPEYGRLLGSVVAAPPAWQTGTSPVDLVQAGSLTATRVLHTDKVALTAAEQAADVDAGRYDVIVDAQGGFSISGPPGYYRIDVAHPHYFPLATVPADDPVDPETVGLFLMAVEADREIDDDFVLEARPALLDLTVVRSLAGDPVCSTEPRSGECVDGATYEVTPLTSAGAPIGAGTMTGTTADGWAAVELHPNTAYQVVIRELVGAEQRAFPVIVTVTVGWSTDGQTSTAVVRAPLVPIAPRVTGTLVATGGRGAAPLPTDADLYELTIEYPVPEALVSDTTGDVEERVQLLDPDCTVAASGDGWTATCAAHVDVSAADTTGVVDYWFDSVPFGDHPVTLAASTVAALTERGYELQPYGGQTEPDALRARSASVTSWGEPNVIGAYGFAVDDVAVEVRVAPDTHLVEFTDVRIDGQARARTTVVRDGFHVLALTLSPSVERYRFDATSALHADVVDADIRVPVVADAATHVVSVLMEPVLVRITGPVRVCDSAGPTCPGLSSTGEVVLTDTTTGDETSHPGPLTEYTFDVPAGAYTLTVTQPPPSPTHAGYTTVTRPVVYPVAAPAGHLAVQPAIQLDAYAKVTVSVGQSDLLDNPVVRLRPTGGTELLTPNAGGSPPAFLVEPGDYDVVLSADNYDETVIHTGTLAAGQTAHWTPTPPRRFQLLVKDSGTATVTVKLFDGPITATSSHVASFDLPASRTGTSELLVPYAEQSWFLSELHVQVTAPTYRTYVQTTGSELQESLTDVTMKSTVRPAGTVTVPGVSQPSGGTLTVSSPRFGAPTQSDSYSGTVTDGTYTFPTSVALGNYPDGTNRIWTISYERPGWGVDTETVLVTPDNNPTDPNLVVEPRDTTVRFRVNQPGPAAAPAVGATVQFAGTSATTGSDGLASFTVPENLTTWAYQASLGNLYRSGTLAADGQRPAGFPPTPITGVWPSATGHVVTLASREVDLTVVDPAGDGVADVTFTICATGATCTPTALAATAQGDGVYRVVAPLTDGSYQITAGAPGHISASTTLSVVGGLPAGVPASITLPFAISVSSTPSTGVTFTQCRLVTPTGGGEPTCTGTTTLTLVSGRFAAPAVDGTYRVTATRTAHRAHSLEFTVDAETLRPSPASLAFTLHDLTVTAAVRRANGTPVTAGITWQICTVAGATCTYAPLTGVSSTATSGVYTFVADRPEGTYRVRVTVGNGANQRQATAEFTIAANGSVQGAQLTFELPD